MGEGLKVFHRHPNETDLISSNKRWFVKIASKIAPKVSNNKVTFLEKQCTVGSAVCSLFYNTNLLMVCLLSEKKIQNNLAQPFTTKSQLLTPLKKKAFENIVRKGENAGNHFLLFPQCFLLFPTKILISESELFCRLQMLSVWTSLKNCCLVKS